MHNKGYFVIGLSRSSRNNVDLEFLIDLKELNSEVLLNVEEAIVKNGKLRVLIYAAGIPLVKKFEEVTKSEYDEILSVNLSSAVFISQLCFRLMKYSYEDNSIIFISSQVALPGCAQGYNSIYSVTKSGLSGLVRSLAQEGGPIIRVNAICPGDVHSNLADKGGEYFCKLVGIAEEEYTERVSQRSCIKRWITPDEIADAAYFLISNPAITGVLMNISGGTITS